MGKRSIGCKSRNPPGSGKDVANGKGVHCVHGKMILPL